MAKSRNNYVIPMIIIGSLFFVFGFITWLNGTLIPYLKIACELESDFQSFLVVFAFFIAYFVMAIPSSSVLKSIGYKKGMALGLGIMAVGAILFVPAALTRNYNLFLIGLFIQASGMALLQTASNPYVSIIGPIESAASRISIMGIGNKVAGLLAVFIFGYITLSDADVIEKSLQTMDAATKATTLNELAGRVIVPYIIIATVFIALAVTILLSSLPDIKDEADTSGKDFKAEGTVKTSVLQFPHLFIGVVTLFLYVGVEVMAVDTITSYGKSIGIELSTARFFPQYTLGCMLIGYIIGILTIPKTISQAKALRICAILGVIFTALAVVTEGMTSIYCIAALGLANSLMWPAIFPLAIDGLGRFTKIGSAFLIMAIVGGALIPLLYAKLSEYWGTQDAYLMTIPCYLFILYFAVAGYKVGRVR